MNSQTTVCRSGTNCEPGETLKTFQVRLKVFCAFCGKLLETKDKLPGWSLNTNRSLIALKSQHDHVKILAVIVTFFSHDSYYDRHDVVVRSYYAM